MQFLLTLSNFSWKTIFKFLIKMLKTEKTQFLFFEKVNHNNFMTKVEKLKKINKLASKSIFEQFQSYKT